MGKNTEPVWSSLAPGQKLEDHEFESFRVPS